MAFFPCISVLEKGCYVHWLKGYDGMSFALFSSSYGPMTLAGVCKRALEDLILPSMACCMQHMLSWMRRMVMSLFICLVKMAHKKRTLSREWQVKARSFNLSWIGNNEDEARKDILTKIWDLEQEFCHDSR